MSHEDPAQRKILEDQGSIVKPEGMNMATIKEQGSENDIQRLSPTPRKSERERKCISYDKLNKGAADSDEED